MSDNDDELAGWGELVENKSAPVEGRDKETLRRAMRLNPALKAALGTTSKVMTALKKAPAPSPNPSTHHKEAPRRAAGNFAEAATQSKERYATELRRLQEQLIKTQREIAELKPHTLDSLVSALLDIDPNMVSPLTLAVLKKEQNFFNEIGFSADKVMERQLKGR
jgi:hypothetical protein